MREILVTTKKRGIRELLEQEKSIAVPNMTVYGIGRGIGGTAGDALKKISLILVWMVS
jgi:hypothetical protein